jgi:hypothetical protein
VYIRNERNALASNGRLDQKSVVAKTGSTPCRRIFDSLSPQPERPVCSIRILKKWVLQTVDWL